MGRPDQMSRCAWYLLISKCNHDDPCYRVPNMLVLRSKAFPKAILASGTISHNTRIAIRKCSLSRSNAARNSPSSSSSHPEESRGKKSGQWEIWEFQIGRSSSGRDRRATRRMTKGGERSRRAPTNTSSSNMM